MLSRPIRAWHGIETIQANGEKSMLNLPSVQHAIVNNSRPGGQEICPLAQTAMSHAAHEICIVLVAGHPVYEWKHVVEAVIVHGILRAT